MWSWATTSAKVLKATIEKHTEGKAAKGDLDALVQRYSVGEAVKVGEWTENGETYDVMRKVFNFGNLPNAGEKAIDHGITDRVKFVRIWGTASDGKPLPLVTHDPTKAIYLTAGSSKITIQTGSADRSALTADVVVEYLRVNS